MQQSLGEIFHDNIKLKSAIAHRRKRRHEIFTEIKMTSGLQPVVANIAIKCCPRTVMNDMGYLPSGNKIFLGLTF